MDITSGCSPAGGFDDPARTYVGRRHAHARHIGLMLTALLLAIQTGDLPLLDPDLRSPRGEEVQAAERRAGKQVPLIVQVCRAAVRSGDLDSYVKRFADPNGLSSYGRVALATDCRMYQQGTKDRER